MKIGDLPRPWLLAAMTGVPMSVLLEKAEKEHAEQAEVAFQKLLGEQYRHAGSVGRQRAMDPRIRLRGFRRLAS